jgi:hypothetical protein
MMGGRFPVGATQFRALFGPDGSTTPSPSPSPAPTTAPPAAATPVTAAPVQPASQPAAKPRPSVRLQVRSTARRVRVAGRVLAGRGGRVRVELRARTGHAWQAVTARSVAVGHDGRFATTVPRPRTGRLRVVASYSGAAATTARSTQTVARGR